MSDNLINLEVNIVNRDILETTMKKTNKSLHSGIESLNSLDVKYTFSRELIIDYENKVIDRTSKKILSFQDIFNRENFEYDIIEMLEGDKRNETIIKNSEMIDEEKVSALVENIYDKYRESYNNGENMKLNYPEYRI